MTTELGAVLQQSFKYLQRKARYAALIKNCPEHFGLKKETINPMSYGSTFEKYRSGYGKPKTTTTAFMFPEEFPATSDRWKPAVKFPQVEELIKAFKPELHICIAGGSILGCLTAVEFGDIDIFPLTKSAVETVNKILLQMNYRISEERRFVTYYEHKNSFFRPVQMITAHIDCEGNVQKLLQRFDLSCVQVAVHGGNLVSNSVAQQDIELKILRCIGTISMTSLMKRIEKYKTRGFKFLDADDEEEKLVRRG